MENYNKARVGNIVGYNLFICRGVPFLLTSVVSEFIFNARDVYTNSNTTIHKNALLPIPLTLQRLQKLGFKQIGRYWMLGKCSVTAVVDGYEVQLGNVKTRIKAVHQLQNFYFSQMQKEMDLPFVKTTS